MQCINDFKLNARRVFGAVTLLEIFHRKTQEE